MFKTGNPFIDLCSLVLVFAPLVPVISILLKKVQQLDLFTYLLLLCLLEFAGSALPWISRPTPQFQVSAGHFFSLVEWIFLMLLFRPYLLPRYRDVLDFVGIAFLSSVTTFFLLKGPDHQAADWEILRDILVLLVGSLSLANVLGNQNLWVFGKPIFWISVGTLFYFFISLLVATAGFFWPGPGLSLFRDRILLLDIAGLIRYFFYFLAVLYYRALPQEP